MSMNQSRSSLSKVVWFLKRFRSSIILGLPGVVALLWLMRLSETFTINFYALSSALFVYVALLVVTAIAHTVITVLLDYRLRDADREASVPKAIARTLDKNE
jgi:hypothetical protein